MSHFDGKERSEAIRQALEDVKDNEEDSDWDPSAQAESPKTKSPVKRGAGVSRRGRRPGNKSAGLRIKEEFSPKKTKIVTGRSGNSYVSVADEYDYTMAHGASDNSIEGLIRARNYDKAMAKAQTLAQDMEEVLFDDDGIGTAPPEALPTRPFAKGDNQEISWQVDRIKQLNKRIQDLEGITFKQKDVLERLNGVDFLPK